MRSPLFTPIAISALATRFVLMSNSAKLVARPSNSKAIALPRLVARSRTMSARLANGCVVMFLPYRLVLMSRSVASSAGEDKTGKVRHGFNVVVPAKARTTTSPPLRSVLLVLRHDALARGFPVVFAPVAELVEIAAHRERLRAVHGDGLAGDPVAAAGDQEHGDVLQFLHGADAAHRVHRLGARAGFVARLDALAHALGRDLARCDRVQPDAVAAPFGGERHRHRMDRGLAHRRRHHVRRAVAHPGRGDRDDVAGLLQRDPALADRMRHVERTAHDNVGDRVEAARRQLLAARDEIPGGVVDEVGEGAVAKDGFDHLLDRERVADIDAVARDAAAILGHQLGRGLVADDLAPAADVHFGAELEKARRHRLAEPGAAAGHEDAPSRQKIFLEHGCFPRSDCRLIDRLTKSGRRRPVKRHRTRTAGNQGESSMEERVSISISEGVADVRLVRADKMNALDQAMFEALVAATDRLSKEKGVRAVVLSGEGRAFCAGLDMGRFAAMKEKGGNGIPGGENRDLTKRTHGQANFAQQAVWGWRQLPVPVIAAIQGVAFGGGFQLALGADMRFLTPDARMSIMEIKWGLVPDMAGTLILASLVRDDILRDLTYTGRIFSAQEAMTYSLATRICDDPRAAALDVAREIAGKSPDAIRAAKRMLNNLSVDPGPALLAESVEQQKLLGSPNQTEAVRANMEKRAPKFAEA